MIAEVTGGPRESEHPESVSGEGRASMAAVPIGEAGGRRFEDLAMEKLLWVTR